MGVFVRFGEERRLQEVREMASGNFGALVPDQVFPQRSHGDECLEVHPAVLEKLRPKSLYELVGHCVMVRDGLKVDPLGTVRARITLRAKRNLESVLVSKGIEMHSLLGSSKVLGDWFPKEADERIGRLERELQNVKEQLVDLGDHPLQAEGILADLAGKVIPI